MHRIVWQALVVVWLLGLHGAPYGYALSLRGSWDGLAFILGAGITVPFAQAGLLGFYLAAGNGRQWQRRLMAGVGLLMILFASGVVANDGSAGVFLLIFALSVLSAALVAAYAIRFPPFLRRCANWPPRFTLGEIGVWLLLAGIVFGAIRWTHEPGQLFRWDFFWAPEFHYLLMHAAVVGVLVTLCGLPLLAHRTPARWWSSLAALAAAGLLPLVEIGAIIVYAYVTQNNSPTWSETLDAYQYGPPLVGAIVGIAWGTMLPLKFTFRSLADKPPDTRPTIPQPPSTAAPTPPEKESDDFRDLQ